MRLTRRAALGGLGASCSGAPALARVTDAIIDPPPLYSPWVWTGEAQQGGFLFGLVTTHSPKAPIRVDGEIIGRVSAKGFLFLVGLDRDAMASARVELLTAAHGWSGHTIPIAPVAYDVQRIDGLPTNQVEPSDPAILARIKEQVARKTAAMASRDDTENFKDGFAWPLVHAVRTSKFGPQRILNGVPKTPHYGVDLAAPTGTPIHAPAPGLVVFADPAMHFEGALTLIDHGQGLISAYLHQSALIVRAGQRVVRGQEIGRVGATGRATGPHLCWRLTWRGRHMDPSLMVGASAPA